MAEVDGEDRKHDHPGREPVGRTARCRPSGWRRHRPARSSAPPRPAVSPLSTASAPNSSPNGRTAMMTGRPARRPLTKSALESGLMLTSTEGSSFGSAVMSQSARQCQRIRLKVASTPLKRRDPIEPLGGAGADPVEPCRLVDHLDAEFGASLSLEPAPGPATTRSVFFDTEPATLAPSRSAIAFASSRVIRSSEPVNTTVLPATGEVARAPASPRPARPRSSSLSSACRLCASAKNSTIASATTSPMPPIDSQLLPRRIALGHRLGRRPRPRPPPGAALKSRGTRAPAAWRWSRRHGGCRARR